MPRKHYEAEYINDEVLIHDGIVFKVKGQDAFLVDVRVIGCIKINGKYYHHNDVLTLTFTPDTSDNEP
jgi:hypothetical protein